MSSAGSTVMLSRNHACTVASRIGNRPPTMSVAAMTEVRTPSLTVRPKPCTLCATGTRNPQESIKHLFGFETQTAPRFHLRSVVSITHEYVRCHTLGETSGINSNNEVALGSLSSIPSVSSVRCSETQVWDMVHPW